MRTADSNRACPSSAVGERPLNPAPIRATPPAALIPLPRIAKRFATITLAETDISNASLAEAALLFSAVAEKGKKLPGPWPQRCRPEVIKADLAKWIERFLGRIKTKHLKKWKFGLEFKKYDSAEAGECSLVLEYPLNCAAIFCDSLITLREEDRSLEEAVLAALRILNWVRPYFDYDDAIEQYIDWADGWLADPPENEENKEVIEKIKWMQTSIPARYRFLFRSRKKRKPPIPKLPPAPPKRSWRYSWWSWAAAVMKAGSGWKRPVPYNLHDGGYYCDLIDPGYFYPLLWSPGDPICDHVDEIINNEFANGGEAIQDFCFRNKSELRRALEGIRVIGEAFDLHMQASTLSRPRKKGEK